jgi:serine/threonine protein kinase
VQDEWLKQTSEFRDNSIFDQFVQLERIGGGGFSSVFRGKEKKTDKEVAIKIIEYFKLSTGEKEVIKR